MNEISQIIELGEQNIASLKNLRSEWQTLQERLSHSRGIATKDDPDPDLNQEFEDAIIFLTQKTKRLPSLLKTLKDSLDVVSTAS